MFRQDVRRIDNYWFWSMLRHAPKCFYTSNFMDGVDTLLNALNTDIDGFVKLVVESSLFFPKRDVLYQHDKIGREWNENKGNLYARRSRNPEIQIKEDKKVYFIHTSGNRWIKLDAYGNNEISKLLRNDYGLNVDHGIASNLHNYNISHIWGKASDPRFFANLWNVVLIPSWANFLMDKNSKNENARKLQETFRAICHNYYVFSELSFDRLDMPSPIVNWDEVIVGQYSIHFMRGDCITVIINNKHE